MLRVVDDSGADLARKRAERACRGGQCVLAAKLLEMGSGYLREEAGARVLPQPAILGNE